MAEEDLLFGKHMHLFGGIEPDNVQLLQTTYSVTNGAPQVLVTIELPNDTTINGKHLCTVAGAAICRKESVYPENEFDGLIADVKYTPGRVYYTDTDVELSKTYCYSVFPYSGQGVYNRNHANRVSCDTKPGIPPGVMKKFVASLNYYNEAPRVKIEYELPTPTLSDSGATLNSISGAVIRKDTTNYPTTENDGEAVTILTDASGAFYDTNVEMGKTYFYTAFPYTTQGLYNRDNVYQNQASAEIGDSGQNIYDVRFIPTITLNGLSHLDYASNQNQSKGQAPRLITPSLAFKIPEECEYVYVVVRSDRFAENPMDTIVSGEARVSFGKVTYLAINTTKYPELVGYYKIDLTDNFFSQWATKFQTSITGISRIQEVFGLYEDIYITVFPAKTVLESPEYLTGVATLNNTFHYRRTEWTVPRPTNVTIQPWSYGQALWISCEIPFDHYMDDEYEVVFAYQKPMNSNTFERVIWTWMTIYQAASGWKTTNTFTTRLRDNIGGSQIEKISTGYRISMAICTISQMNTYLNNAQTNKNEYVLPIGVFGSIVSDTKRFVPMVSDDEFPVLLLNSTSPAAYSIEQNQLATMEALADIYETTANV